MLDRSAAMHLFDKIIIMNLTKFNGREKAHFVKWDYMYRRLTF